MATTAVRDLPSTKTPARPSTGRAPTAAAWPRARARRVRPSVPSTTAAGARLPGPGSPVTRRTGGVARQRRRADSTAARPTHRTAPTTVMTTGGITVLTTVLTTAQTTAATTAAAPALPLRASSGAPAPLSRGAMTPAAGIGRSPAGAPRPVHSQRWVPGCPSA